MTGPCHVAVPVTLQLRDTSSQCSLPPALALVTLSATVRGLVAVCRSLPLPAVQLLASAASCCYLPFRLQLLPFVVQLLLSAAQLPSSTPSGFSRLFIYCWFSRN